MELSAELMKKIEMAYSGHRLVGDTVFSDEEYESLLAYTRNFASSFLRGIGSYMKGDDNIHFVTLVEIAKRWKIANDDDDESGFWPHVYNSINATGYQLTNQREWTAYTDIIRGLGKIGKIQIATSAGKKYYATLMMHAFAPTKSIKAFLNLCYNIYKRDLGFNYTESDKWVCDVSTIRFCEILQDAVGGDKTVSVGTNTYSVKIGLRSLALSSATQNDFSALIDRSLTAIHKLFHRQGFNQGTYFDNLIYDWWQGKLAEATIDKTHRHNTLSAVTKQTITAKFIRDDKTVNLTIPPIRLDSRGKTVWLSVYAGQNLEQRYSDDMPTRYGELTVTTAQKEFDLDILFKHGEPVKLRVEITENGITIFDKTIERDFILFDGENEVLSQLNKVNNYFVYARNTDALRMPTECSRVWNSNNLYNIYPKEGEAIQGTNQHVYFVDSANGSGKKGEVDLLGGLSNCEWIVNDTSYAVFAGAVRLIVQNEIALNGLELVSGSNKKLLTDMPNIQEDGFRLFDITGRLASLEPTEVSLYSHLKEKYLIKKSIVIFPSLNISFSKLAYYGADEKKLTVSIDGDSKVLTWDNTQSEIVYPMNDGELIVKIPYTRWRIDSKPWQNERLDNRAWYKDHFHDGSLLEIESALDKEDAVLYAIGNRLAHNQDIVERNKITGKFEIGRYIYSHLGKTEIMFLLKTSKQQLIELFVVSTEEHFEYPPLGIVDDKVVFVGGDSFIGESGRKFTIEFKSVGREEQIFQSDKLEKGIVPINEGIYWVTVKSKSSGMFAKADKIFWQDEFVFGDKDRLKLSNMILRISPIAGIGMTDSFWNSSKRGYRISNLKRIEINADTYKARIYYTDGIGNMTAVGGTSECLIEVISSSALTVLVADDKGEYTQKLTFDASSKEIKAPNTPNLFKITNYNFVEVKDV